MSPNYHHIFHRWVGSVCACLDLSVTSSSWGLGRAAVCDCGTPWTFLLPFLARSNWIDFRPRLTSESTAWIAIKRPSQQYFSSLETLPPNSWDFYPTRSHDFGSCLVTISSALEALGAHRGPRWAGAMLFENRKLVYAGNRYNDIHCFRIFPKDFWSFMRFFGLCFFFFFFFFFASLHIMKSRKKQKNKKQTNKNKTKKKKNKKKKNKTNRSNKHIILSKFFRLSHDKSVQSMCYQKNLHQSVPYAQNESCLAYKETANG